MSEEPPNARSQIVLSIFAGLTLLVLGVVHFVGLVKAETRPSTAQGLEQQFENQLKEKAAPPLGRLRGRLGLNANNVVQREGELFFLPDLEHLTGPSFLEGKQRASSHVVLEREAEELPRATNPVAAIETFAQQLKERGITLVLLPTPSKGMFAGEEGTISNVAYRRFLQDVADLGVMVVDLSATHERLQEKGTPLFLKTDSHWTPRAMTVAAHQVVETLKAHDLVPEVVENKFEVETVQVMRGGDLGRLFGKDPEQVALSAVTHDGHPWAPDPKSSVILLGDSFSTVFSKEGKKGPTAGFAESLSASLGFAVDRIAREGDGALASRKELMTQPERLRGKKVVIWQFATRELSFGDWQVLPWAEREEIEADSGVTWKGTIAAVAPIPDLSKTPYRWATMEIHLVDVIGEDAPSEIVLLTPAVLDRKPTDMIKRMRGQEIQFEARTEIPEAVERWQRFVLPDVNFTLLHLPRIWIESGTERDEP